MTKKGFYLCLRVTQYLALLCIIGLGINKKLLYSIYSFFYHLDIAFILFFYHLENNYFVFIIEITQLVFFKRYKDAISFEESATWKDWFESFYK